MERNLRKERTGLVVSNKMDKSITVAVHLRRNTRFTGSSSTRPRSSLLTMRKMNVTSGIQ